MRGWQLGNSAILLASEVHPLAGMIALLIAVANAVCCFSRTCWIEMAVVISSSKAEVEKTVDK
jgi:hypothetical protein